MNIKPTTAAIIGALVGIALVCVFAAAPADNVAKFPDVAVSGGLGVTGSITNTALTASRAVVSAADKSLASSATTSTELGYVSGVTSAIQTQLNGKQASLGYTPVNKAGDSMSGTLSTTGFTNTARTASTFVVAAADKSDTSTAASSVLASTLTDETGSSSGVAVFNRLPTFNDGIGINASPTADTLLLIQTNINSATPTAGIILTNGTAAAVGAQKVSPAIYLQGNGWETTGGSSQPVAFRLYTLPLQGTSVSGLMNIDRSINNAAWANVFQMTSGGAITINGSFVSGGFVVAGSSSAFQISTRSEIYSPSNGQLRFTGTGASAFTGILLGPDSATATAVYIRGQSGTGTDKVGGDWSGEGGIGTGTAKSGAVIFKTGNSRGQSDSTAHAQTERFHAIPKWVTLTDNGVVTLFTVPVLSTNYVGLVAAVTIYSSDGTVHQSQTTTITVDATAASTTITTAISPSAAQTGGVLPSASTLSSTYTAVDAGSNVLAVKVQSDTSLSPTVMHAKIVIMAINSNGTGTITEQ